MNRTLLAALACVVAASSANGNLVISQYVETNSGTSPKGIELWNISGATIDFAVTGLSVLQGTNGGAPAAGFTLNTGTLAAGSVIVIGTPDMEATAVGNGATYYERGYTFNGDDSLVVQLGGMTTDTFGMPGSDPGSAWSGGGVSTANSNLALIEPVDLDSVSFTSFTDPSIRFETIGTTGAGLLTGFGIAPAAIPEPTAALFGSLVAGGLGLMVARRPADRG